MPYWHSLNLIKLSYSFSVILLIRLSTILVIKIFIQLYTFLYSFA
nr:MAG TPA: hypothetical protein [Caudoviricetes sp.]